MNKSVISIIAAVTLSSCSTTVREIRDHEPRATYTSTRTVAALEACLAGNLSWTGTPAIIHGEGFTELAFGSGGSIVVLITLRAQGAATEVQVRQLLVYGARVHHNVDACVSGRDK